MPSSCRCSCADQTRTADGRCAYHPRNPGRRAIAQGQRGRDPCKIKGRISAQVGFISQQISNYYLGLGCILWKETGRYIPKVCRRSVGGSRVHRNLSAGGDPPAQNLIAAGWYLAWDSRGKRRVHSQTFPDAYIVECQSPSHEKRSLRGMGQGGWLAYMR